jgi:hypothetical protein
MHTQLVAMLERYRHAVDLHYFHRFLRYRARRFETHAGIARRTSTGPHNCNDHCELQGLGHVSKYLIGKVGGNLYSPVTRQSRGTTTLVSKEERTPGTGQEGRTSGAKESA